MAEKSLTESQVRELLTNGRTGTIRGFKSKTGKKFDARVALNRDEAGKVTGLKFDFTHLEPVKVKDVVELFETGKTKEKSNRIYVKSGECV